MRPEAVEAMLPFLGVHHDNPSGAHAAARHARRVVDDARDVVAALVGCSPGEVVFTSGGTESDATALAGVVGARPGALLVGAIEHHAVGDGAVAAARLGGTVHPLAVDGRGRVATATLEAAVAEAPSPPTVISVALGNNEVGTIQPLDALAEVRDRMAPDAVLHTDAVQAAPWLDLPTLAGPAALVSLSAHKMGGPKGVGALVVRDGTPFAPLVRGGGQERGRRSGTHNVAGIVGFGVAARLVAEQRASLAASVAARRDRLAVGLLAALTPLVPGAVETVVGADGDRGHVLPGHLHLCLPGVAADEVLFLLDQEGVAASAASSCASGATESSHVLRGLGVDEASARGSLRLTLGWSTTDADVDRALEVVPRAVASAVGAPVPSSAGT
ncbi:cysteine desulfurase family protein [soil metagenome]